MIGNDNLGNAVGFQFSFPVQVFRLHRNVSAAGRNFRNLHIPDGNAAGSIDFFLFTGLRVPFLPEKISFVQLVQNALPLLHITQIGCHALGVRTGTVFLDQGFHCRQLVPQLGRIIHIAGLDIVLVEVFAGTSGVDDQLRLSAYRRNAACFGYSTAGNGNIHLVVDARFQCAFHVYKVIVRLFDISFTRLIRDQTRTRRGIWLEQIIDYLGVLLYRFRPVVRRYVDIADRCGVSAGADFYLMIVFHVIFKAGLRFKRSDRIVVTFHNTRQLYLSICPVHIAACVKVNIVTAG